jgi:hypothetical protein
MQCLLSFPLQIATWSAPQLIDVEIFEMLAQPLAALMAKGNNLAMCPRRNRGDVPLMGGAFLTRALGSLVQVCKDRDEGISIRNRF